MSDGLLEVLGDFGAMLARGFCDSVGFSAHLHSSYLGFCQLVLLRVWTSHGASNSLMSPNSFHILYKLVVGGMCGVCLSKPGLDK